MTPDMVTWPEAAQHIGCAWAFAFAIVGFFWAITRN